MRLQSFVVLLALGLALLFQIVALRAHSLSGDGAYHLLAGHQALRYGQNTMNLEHPPLAKLLFALPLLFEKENLWEPLEVDEALVVSSQIFSKPELLQRATLRGRELALVFLVIPFLCACFMLGWRFAGFASGFILVLMLAFSLSVLPYLTLLQTDTAVATFFVVVVLCCRRYLENASHKSATLMGLAVGLGVACKFSAVLLAPTVLLSVVLGRCSWRRRLMHGLLILTVALAFLEGTYRLANLRYESATGRSVISAYCENQGTLTVDDQMRRFETPLLALEAFDPYLAQWATGFLGVHVQNRIGVYGSYAFGEISSQGRWWYFPSVLLLKTPLAILVAGLWLLLVRARAPSLSGRAWIPVTTTTLVYLFFALSSNYNLSVRHLLPVLPFLYLPIAGAIAGYRRARLLLILALALESVAVMPLWMSATNTWWLGSLNPTRLALSAGNLEYRQNFIQLADFARDQDIETLTVVYPSVPEEVIRAYLPDARLPHPRDPIEPGWYAVNVLVEQFVPGILEAQREKVHDYENLYQAADLWRPYWHAVRQGEDHGYVAGTFHLYRHVGEP